MRIIAHRGARSKAPENTILSLNQAITLGVWGVEFDVTCSKDGIPLLIHGSTMAPNWEKKILTNGIPPEGKGWPSLYTFNALSSLDAGSWFNSSFNGAKIPKLKEALELNWGRVVQVIEVKVPGSSYSLKTKLEVELKEVERLTTFMLPIIREYFQNGKKCEVISFSPILLKKWRKVLSGVPFIYLPWGENSTKERAIEVAIECGAYGVGIEDTMFLKDPDWVEFCKGSGLEVFIYESTPKDYSLHGSGDLDKKNELWSRAYKAGVFSIATDYPEELLAFIG